MDATRHGGSGSRTCASQTVWASWGGWHGSVDRGSDRRACRGVKFLYQQAAEVLSAWRARRRDCQAPPPSVVEPPGAVRIERPRPLPDPASPEMADTLQELKDLVEPIKDGEVDPEAIAARQAVARLRELLEVIMASPITFAGEPLRAVDVSDKDVVVKRVAGEVVGVRRPGQASGPSLHPHGPCARARCGHWRCGDRRGSDLNGPGGAHGHAAFGT
jgi:hypothetical protein